MLYGYKVITDPISVQIGVKLGHIPNPPGYFSTVLQHIVKTSSFCPLPSKRKIALPVVAAVFANANLKKVFVSTYSQKRIYTASIKVLSIWQLQQSLPI